MKEFEVWCCIGGSGSLRGHLIRQTLAPTKRESMFRFLSNEGKTIAQDRGQCVRLVGYQRAITFEGVPA
jgi:hypothetical protein